MFGEGTTFWMPNAESTAEDFLTIQNSFGDDMEGRRITPGGSTVPTCNVSPQIFPLNVVVEGRVLPSYYRWWGVGGGEKTLGDDYSFLERGVL